MSDCLVGTGPTFVCLVVAECIQTTCRATVGGVCQLVVMD